MMAVRGGSVYLFLSHLITLSEKIVSLLKTWFDTELSIEVEKMGFFEARSRRGVSGTSTSGGLVSFSCSNFYPAF